VTATDYLIAVGLSMAPIAELRGGLPYALSQGAAPGIAYAVAVAANLAVVPLILVGLGWAERVFRRWEPTRRLIDALFKRTRRKGRLVERLGSVGLILLVAIPLPGTGAWTGAVASVLLGIPFRRALGLIAMGVLTAGLLVLLASLGAFSLFGVG
jgi:uncharacterized membrane protein